MVGVVARRGWESVDLGKMTRALHTFPFSVDAYLNWGYIYRYMVTPKQPQLAKEAYQKAVTCAKLLWPELDRQGAIEWGYIEYRPYLWAVAGLAYAHHKLGDLDEAIKGFRYLLKVNPNDNQGVRQDMFFALLESGDYTLAEQFFQTQENPEADLCYGNVLIQFRKFRREEVEEEQDQKALVPAIVANTYVPDMLLNLQENDQIPKMPPSYSPGKRDEALKVVHRVGKAWRTTPGLAAWFRSQAKRGGNKPNDDGSILFEMLQEGSVLVVLNSDDRGIVQLNLTTKVSMIPGRALPDFYLAPGMKSHDPQRIVAFDNRKAYGHGDVSWSQKYVSFSYDEVQSMPFWKILHAHQKSLAEKQEEHCHLCYENARYCCAACKVTWYCSKKCQADDWKGRGSNGMKHKIMCQKFQKA